MDVNAVPLLRPLLLFLLIAWGIFQAVPAYAGFGDFFKGVKDAVQGDQELSQSQIIEGLKEALLVGTGNAVVILPPGSRIFSRRSLERGERVSWDRVAPNKSERKRGTLFGLALMAFAFIAEVLGLMDPKRREEGGKSYVKGCTSH